MKWYFSNRKLFFALQYFVRGIMVFNAPTITYGFLWHINPYMFGEYGIWTVYYVNVFFCFSMMNLIVNWLCTILYDPSYPKTKDNPFLEGHNFDKPPEQFIPLIEQSRNQTNVQCVYDMTAKEALPWEYCEKCDIHIPPRAHHCKVCQKCVLKRDHHCFLVGNCVGFKNQRYFIMMNFYLMFLGFIAGCITVKYIQLAVWPTLGHWWDIIFPVTIWKSIFGNIPGIYALIALHVFLEFFFGFVGFVYFTSQMVMSAQGKTTYEFGMKVPIKNNNSATANMKSIFGELWMLNFLFPMTLVLRQTGDGIHWENIKIDYTVKNGHSSRKE